MPPDHAGGERKLAVNRGFGARSGTAEYGSLEPSILGENVATSGRKNGREAAPKPSFEATLWAAADKLRGNMDAAEYKHVALGFIFLKYISDRFEERYDEAFDDPDITRGLAQEFAEDRD
jgi:hypothetical protein